MVWVSVSTEEHSQGRVWDWIRARVQIAGQRPLVLLCLLHPRQGWGKPP